MDKQKREADMMAELDRMAAIDDVFFLIPNDGIIIFWRGEIIGKVSFDPSLPKWYLLPIAEAMRLAALRQIQEAKEQGLDVWEYLKREFFIYA